MNKLRLALASGLFLAMPLSASMPAHAADTCRTGSTSYTASDLNASGFTCQLGDKIYSDFTVTGLTSGSFIFTSPVADVHTFQGQGLGLSGPATASYSYKVTIDSTMSPLSRFYKFSTSTTLTDLGAGVTSSKTLTDGTNTVTSTDGVNSGSYTYSPLATGPISFSSNISVTDGLLTQFTDTVMQKDMTPSVPGPLPVLGAGVAFGCSRQLRKRIKAAS